MIRKYNWTFTCTYILKCNYCTSAWCKLRWECDNVRCPASPVVCYSELFQKAQLCLTHPSVCCFRDPNNWRRWNRRRCPWVGGTSLRTRLRNWRRSRKARTRTEPARKYYLWPRRIWTSSTTTPNKMATLHLIKRQASGRMVTGLPPPRRLSPTKRAPCHAHCPTKPAWPTARSARPRPSPRSRPGGRTPTAPPPRPPSHLEETKYSNTGTPKRKGSLTWGNSE